MTASLPLVGPVMAWAIGDLAAAAPAADAAVSGAEAGMATVLWSYMDHASSHDWPSSPWGRKASRASSSPNAMTVW